MQYACSTKKDDGEEDPLKIYTLCIKLGSHNFFFHPIPLFAPTLSYRV